MNLTCSWWCEPRCINTATHLTLMSCEEGHIREKILCAPHHAITIKYINQMMLYCNQCPHHISIQQTKTPIQNTWNLEGPLNDVTPIPTTYGLVSDRENYYTKQQLDQNIQYNYAITEYFRKILNTRKNKP